MIRAHLARAITGLSARLSRKRLLKLAILIVALAPFARALAATVEGYVGFRGHPSLPGWSWSSKPPYLPLNVSNLDYTVAVQPLSPPPGGDCALQIEGSAVANGLHHIALPKSFNWTGCDDFMAGYINNLVESRTVLCQLFAWQDASAYSANVAYSTNGGCPTAR
jgi:hypothetical protein